MAKCSICGDKAIAYVPYQRRYYCRRHYAEFVESKVARTVERYRLIRRGDRVVAAVSGGKDSVTLLSTLSILRERIGFELVALHIDLGIGEYSSSSRRIVEELARMLDAELIVYDVGKTLGFTIPSASRLTRRPACSVCGAVKRYIYNSVGVELDAKVATGHNADDIIGFAMKNFIMGDLEGLSKLTPIVPGVEGLAAPRIRPLYSVYEKESFLYVLSKGLPYIHRDCPYARFTSLEFQFKEFFNKLEESRPSIKLGFLNSIARRFKALVREGPYYACSECGLLSSSSTCTFCRLTRRLTGKPLGRRVRLSVKELLDERIKG